MPETTTPQLSEDAVREIESSLLLAVDGKAMVHADYVAALIRDWKAMRAENDTLKDELEVADDALENQSQWMSESRAELAQLQSQNVALREQLAEARTWIDRKNAAIETWQQQAKEYASQLAQVTGEPLNATIDLLEQRRRSLGQEAIPEYARTINFLQAILNEGKKEYPPLRTVENKHEQR